MKKSRLTKFDRATPVQREKMRVFALARKCLDCGAEVGQPCRGMAGGVAKPHERRRRNALN